MHFIDFYLLAVKFVKKFSKTLNNISSKKLSKNSSKIVGHGHSHNANKVRTDCTLLIFYLFSSQILVLSNVLLATFGWVLFAETDGFLQFNTIFVINDFS